MPKKLNKTLLSLTILGILNYLAVFVSVSLLIALLHESGGSGNQETIGQIISTMFLIIFAIFFGTFMFIIKRSLKKGKYWAWIAGIIVSGLMCTNITIVFGIPSLMGLLAKETKDFINKNNELDKRAI